MKAYKGFDKDLKCRGYQFEIGGEYEEKKADLCKTGFLPEAKKVLLKLTMACADWERI